MLSFMAVVLVIMLEIPMPVTSSHSTQHVIYNNRSVSQDEAQGACSSAPQGHLADDTTNYTSLTTYMTDVRVQTSWTAVRRRDLGAWLWLDGTEYKTSGPPIPGASCGGLSTTTRQLERLPCTDTGDTGAICQHEDLSVCVTSKIGDGCLVVNRTVFSVWCRTSSWQTARQHCDSQGAVLAKFESSNERQTVVDLAISVSARTRCTSYWVGVRREDWVVQYSGAGNQPFRSLQTFHWLPGQPATGPLCATVVTSQNRIGWTAANCSDRHHSVCFTVKASPGHDSSEDFTTLMFGLLAAAVGAVAILVVVLLIIMYVCVRRRRRRKERKELALPENVPFMARENVPRTSDPTRAEDFLDGPGDTLRSKKETRREDAEPDLTSMTRYKPGLTPQRTLDLSTPPPETPLQSQTTRNPDHDQWWRLTNHSDHWNTMLSIMDNVTTWPPIKIGLLSSYEYKRNSNRLFSLPVATPVNMWNIMLVDFFKNFLQVPKGVQIREYFRTVHFTSFSYGAESYKIDKEKFNNGLGTMIASECDIIVINRGNIASDIVNPGILEHKDNNIFIAGDDHFDSDVISHIITSSKISYGSGSASSGTDLVIPFSQEASAGYDPKTDYGAAAWYTALMVAMILRLVQHKDPGICQQLKSTGVMTRTLVAMSVNDDGQNIFNPWPYLTDWEKMKTILTEACS